MLPTLEGAPAALRTFAGHEDLKREDAHDVDGAVVERARQDLDSFPD